MKNKLLITSITLCLFLIFICGCTNSSVNSNIEGEMRVHYINVNQGDSILIQVNNKNVLIDAGPRDSKTALMDYLKDLNLEKLDYVIATHPHEDHIGNMADIIHTFKVENFIAPKVQSTTKTFERMVSALKDKNLKIAPITAKDNYINLGDDTKVSVLSPSKDKYESLNNYSPVIKVQYKNTSFLFTGDAEKEVEKEIISANYNISADVLKLGHHGSSSSTSEQFLSKVNPSICVISVGKDNSYGHPHKETLDLINKNNLTVYRTDKDGNIVLISDGTNIYKNK